MEQLGVDIAARQHADHDLALDVELAGEQRRKAYCSPGFYNELELAEREGDRAADLRVARGNPLAHQLAVDLEGDGAGRVGHQRVADRTAHARIDLALAAPERARGIVEALGLRRIELRIRHPGLDRERGTGDQAAAGGADHDNVRLQTKYREILDDLAPDRALPRDHHR